MQHIGSEWADLVDQLRLIEKQNEKDPHEVEVSLDWLTSFLMYAVITGFGLGLLALGIWLWSIYLAGKP